MKHQGTCNCGSVGPDCWGSILSRFSFYNCHCSHCRHFVFKPADIVPNSSRPLRSCIMPERPCVTRLFVSLQQRTTRLCRNDGFVDRIFAHVQAQTPSVPRWTPLLNAVIAWELRTTWSHANIYICNLIPISFATAGSSKGRLVYAPPPLPPILLRCYTKSGRFEV
jgi:hypothetical protein